MGVYFATGSRDKTARLWSTDRTSALRIYAGHLSDVDVRPPLEVDLLMLTTSSSPSVCKVSSQLAVFGDRIE